MIDILLPLNLISFLVQYWMKNQSKIYQQISLKFLALANEADINDIF